ncbi:SdrD B-like domain-containing protein [Candidatus Chloroploca asiatica]|uniref:SD-repeat containing protein B domain-containing protein n=1 Tax=Candidatus Chloroploca asiatica TaxID=1506545 RepID=A0A2H3KS69_9CHLR|nr:SdrD B-like domain-containing protein [Candidatus Chloroploca asiatica]PDW00465.1 hypothetical protein A9Q02_09765 [Candidatus Chloroploca asiatica]
MRYYQAFLLQLVFRGTLLLFFLLPLFPTAGLVLRPASAEAHVTPAGAFGSAVGCLQQPDQFITSRYANTMYLPPGSTTEAAAARNLPAVQGLTMNSAGAILATIGDLGAIYGLAYDDGAVSGRERIFAAAYTKRLTPYGPGGPGAIYVLTRTPTGWHLEGHITAPGASGVNRPTSIPPNYTDEQAIAGVGTTSLGDITISPDGRTLYVVNLGPKRIERFDLTRLGLPRYSGSLPIDLSVISSDPAVQADLWPFAIAFWPFSSDRNAPHLVVGLTDSAARGGGAATASGDYFQVPPRIYVLAQHLGVGPWALALHQDLGNTLIQGISQRHAGTLFEEVYSQWPGLTRSWNPWREDLQALPRFDNSVFYAQPMLTAIEFLNEAPSTGSPAQGRPLMILGLRDRTGDQSFNGNAQTPDFHYSSIAQGDTLTYRLNSSWQWVFQSGEAYEDNDYQGMATDPIPAHSENHMGALASVLNSQTSVENIGTTLGITALRGRNAQEVRVYEQASGAVTSSAISGRAPVIAGETASASKASNLGDLEVLCNYALIGGRVWDDLNGDGIRQTGEPAMANVALELFQGIPRSAPVMSSTARAVTDSQGRYLFAVPPNTNFGIRITASGGSPGQWTRATLAQAGYHFTLPHAVADDTIRSNVDPALGIIEFAYPNEDLSPYAIRPPWNRADERTFDLGLTRQPPTGRIGDWVWLDTNRNGLQDDGATGVAGVTVALEEATLGATLPRLVDPVTTGGNGAFAFTDLPPGLYQVRFSNLPFAPTLLRQGSDRNRDSDANASTGYATGWIRLQPHETRNDLDLGLVSEADLWVTKQGPPSVRAGVSFEYTLAYGNQGSSVAAGVEMRDLLPPGLTYVAAQPAPTTVNGNDLRWSIGALHAGATGSIRLTVRAATTFSPPDAVRWPVENQATISTTSYEVTTANNEARYTTELLRPELGLSKTAPTHVLAGETFTYQLDYHNSGSTVARNLGITDQLPANVAFVAFEQNPGNICHYLGTAIECALLSLAPGGHGTIRFQVRALPSEANALVNEAHISTTDEGDRLGNNQATTTTLVQYPDLGLSLQINPRPLPVGETGTINLSYRNSGPGISWGSVLTVTLDAETRVGNLTGNCQSIAPLNGEPRVQCNLGEINANAAGSVVVPVQLPATPLDAATYAANTLTARGTIAGITPERSSTLANNRASDQVDVTRPNVWVRVQAVNKSLPAAGPAGWLSFVRFRVTYGNNTASLTLPPALRHPAHLTRPAAGTSLRIMLPSNAELEQVSDATGAPLGGYVRTTDASGAPMLVFDYGTLVAHASGDLYLTVRVREQPGAIVGLAARIATTTPGDETIDNSAADATDIVAPPTGIDGTGVVRLAMHSEFDPNHGGSDPNDAVYLSEGTRITWPAGEVLDFTPRLTELRVNDPFSGLDPLLPYAYYGRVVGWSVVNYQVNGRTIDARSDADAAGRVGCRVGSSTLAQTALAGCTYIYPGATTVGGPINAVLPTAPLTENEMQSQGHVYWTHRGPAGTPLPTMRSDVYLFTLDPMEEVRLTVAIEVEVWVVNLYPGAPLGDWTLNPIRITSIPEVRQIYPETFGITLVVPRSVVGPGHRPGGAPTTP